jgi:predicted dehydrogenase
MIRFGVVGTGYWAEQVHLPVLHASESVELVGIWGRSLEKATALGTAFGGTAFPRFEDMLAQVDALSFVVPPDIQASLIPQAAGAGKHLLLEKPVALTMEAAERALHAVEDAGVSAVVFLTRTFTHAIEREIRRLAAEGPWQYCSARFHAGALNPGSPFAGSAWRQLHGALWDLGPHLLSVLIPIMGPVREIRATRDEGGMVRLELRHESGARSEATATLLAEPADQGEGYVFTAGSRSGSLQVSPAPRQQAFGAALSALLAMIGGNREGESRFGVRAGVEITRILAAAEEDVSGSPKIE